MKIIRIVLSAVLIFFLILAWVSQIKGNVGNAISYSESVSKGDEYAAKELYQKSIQCYSDAIKINESEELRNKMAEAYKAGYEKKMIEKKEYVSFLNSSADMYKKSPKFWEMLINLYVESGEYKKGYDVYKKTQQYGASSEEISSMKDVVKYAIKEKVRTYAKIFYSPNGRCVVYDGKNWRMLDEAGKYTDEIRYDFMSAVSSAGDCIVDTPELGPRVIDEKGVIQCFIGKDDFSKIKEARACSEDFIPVSVNDSWEYYNCEKNELSNNSYDDASSFQNGKAVVKSGDSWVVINPDFSATSTTFDDIKLQENGEYLYEKYLVASIEGKYGLFDKNFSPKAQFDATDADAYYGGWLAFRDSNNKWGFVDQKGNIKIEPEYENAKSFSNGLAAVCEDGKWGFINENNDMVIANQYIDAKYFSKSGITYVSKDKDQYYIIELVNGIV